MTSVDSNELVHKHSLVRAFAVHIPYTQVEDYLD